MKALARSCECRARERRREAALTEALDGGQVGFAALNVAEGRLIAGLFAANATRFLEGHSLLDRVNTVECY